MKCCYIVISFTLVLHEAVIHCRAKKTQFFSPFDVGNHININLLPKDCGLVHPQKRIVGGQPANLFEFPWIVLLLPYDIKDEIQYDCAGTVINRRHILTSAVCGSHKALKTVRLGKYNITSNKDCVITTAGVEICAPPFQDIPVEKIIVHPYFSDHLKTYDIALLRLSSDIIFNDAVWPVCLPLTPVTITDSLIGIGWGLTNYLDHESRSDILLKVKLPYVNVKSCLNISSYRNYKLAIKSGICAGQSGKDTCTGDSGGPLLYLNTTDNDVRYVQVGITSFDIGCGVQPAVYSNVTLYMKWILDNLQ